VLDGVSIGGPPAELVPPVPPVPLAAVSGDVSAKLADAIKEPQIDIELEGVSLRVADNGALELGVELAQDRVRDEFAWFTFNEHLCRVGDQAYDWALAVDAQRMTEILHVRAGRFNQSLAADPDAGSRSRSSGSRSGDRPSGCTSGDVRWTTTRASPSKSTCTWTSTVSTAWWRPSVAPTSACATLLPI
jgi:hypothetical protein